MSLPHRLTIEVDVPRPISDWSVDSYLTDGGQCMVRVWRFVEGATQPGDRESGDEFNATDMMDWQIVEKAFATIQYLTDHELREGYKVNGIVWFDPHQETGPPGSQPSGIVADQHKAFYVERMEAVYP